MRREVRSTPSLHIASMNTANPDAEWLLSAGPANPRTSWPKVERYGAPNPNTLSQCKRPQGNDPQTETPATQHPMIPHSLPPQKRDSACLLKRETALGGGRAPTSLGIAGLTEAEESIEGSEPQPQLLRREERTEATTQPASAAARNRG